MASFVRRFREFPTLDVLTEIEAVNIIDLVPNDAPTGVGSGALLLVGEFEDGPFNEPVELFSSQDFAQQFGGLGFTYNAVPSQNACARRHLSELWNGNGFLRAKYAKAQRFMVCRVDTSVGTVAFSPLAVLLAGKGPFALAAGDVLTFTSNIGGPTAMTAIAAVAAVRAGANFAASGFVGGETIGVQIDSGSVIPVVFTAADQSEAQVAARISAVLGYAAGSVSTGVDITGIVKGTAGRVTVSDITTGALAAIGMTAGTTSGTGNVASVDAVTPAELAAIINGTAGLVTIDVTGTVDADGHLRVQSDTPGTGTILVAASAVATTVGFNVIGTAVKAGEHVAGIIKAGTRVRTAGGLEWVTTQTLVVLAGTNASPNIGPHLVKVRPAFDDGTAVGTGANTAVVVVDQPTFATMAVTNPNALTVAKTEPQMDVAYKVALDATLDLSMPAREANHLVVARRTPAVVRDAVDNAEQASNQGCFGRKYNGRAPFGFTLAQAIADVANYRSDRHFYTWPAWKVTIPEIAIVGVAGGLGFTADGMITMGADAPLATINCSLPPETNPGQETGLIDRFLEVETQAVPLTIAAYKALKAAGICAPRRDRTSGSVYQSGVTSSLTSGRTTIARRKMADFIQDTFGQIGLPYAKKVATQARIDGMRGDTEEFLSGLKSEQQPENQRINDYAVDDVRGNTPAMQARGVQVLITTVRTLSTLDAIVFQTEIGEGVVINTEL